MSSRQEEKERRRREREEKEQAEKAAAARRKRLQLIFGVVLAVLVLGGGVPPSPSACSVATSLAPRHARRQRGHPGATGGGPRRGREGRRLQDRERAQRGQRPRGEGVQALRLQAEPADLGQPLPAVVPGRHLRAGQHSGARPARPHARARPDQHPVQARHAGATPSASSRRSTTRWTAATTCCCTKTPPGCRSPSPRPPGTTSSGCPTMNPQVFDAIRAFRDEWIDKGPEKVA